MNYLSLRSLGLTLLLGIGLHLRAYTQDTLNISLPQAEQLFFKQNLSLMAEKYNITMAQAQVIQARLYPNPNIQFTGDLYNPVLKKWVDVSNSTGEYAFGVQQLILLAGKRNKQVQLAETNTVMAENRFFDLMRTLRFTLRSDFYQAYFLQNSISAYGIQISTLEELSRTYDQLETKGVVTLKDAIRIKSLLYSLKGEQTTLQNQLNDVESELQMLLQNNHAWFVPISNIDVASLPLIRQTPLQDLMDTAYNNRYDLKLAQNNVLYSQQNYNLQKALAVPDLTLGSSFDKRGSFVENPVFFNLSIDLPFFNRNQGNIRAARSAIDQSKLLLDRQRLTVENDVQNAYRKALATDNMLGSVDPHFRGQFEDLLKSVTLNFQKRNISLLEFTDFYNSYKENILQLNNLQNARMQAIETLNFTIGKTLFNY
jgi:cobalt-zinc-cadmium efflux system outer membrane protein